MKWMLFTGLILLTACSTSKLRFVKVGHQPDKEVQSTRHQSLQEQEETTILLVAASSISESESDSLPTFHSSSLLEESKNGYYVLINEAVSIVDLNESTSRIVPRELNPEKTPEKYIRSANILLLIALALLSVAFTLLIFSITGGFGLPFIYIYLSSLILFVIGSVKLNKGYKTFESATGDKELLYKQYLKGKFMRIILEIFLGIWIIIFVFLLVLPLIKFGIELTDFLFSGGFG